MKFIVPIGYLRAAMLAQSKDDVRYYLNGIHFKGNKIESTNGHIAYQATLNQGLNDVCNELDKTITEDCQVPGDLIIKIDEKIPATTRKRNIAFAKIELEDKNKVLIRYLDHMNAQVDVGHGDVIEGRFPDIDRMLTLQGEQEKRHEDVNLNAEFIGVAHKIGKTLGTLQNKVTLSTINNQSIVTFKYSRVEYVDNKEFLVVMPIYDLRGGK